LGVVPNIPTKLANNCFAVDDFLISYLTRFRRTSDGDVIPGPEQGFDIVGGYFSADIKSFLSHSLNMHFPITRSSMAFLKIKVMLLS
jgi:hypothetical protein